MTFEYVLEHCHWIKKVDDYHYEMFLDHHSLSTFRLCEQMFVHEHIEGWHSKAEVTKMPWFFAIGLALHDALEYLYEQKRDGTYLLQNCIDQFALIWHKRKMESYVGDKEYNALGGLTGFLGMLTQYSIFYNNDTERLRIIGTEIAFGKGREVRLGSFEVGLVYIDCYLAGRIDFLMDNGKQLGPMDHKSMAFIDGDPISKYNPQDGMTGYIFATKQIVEKNFPDIASQRQLNMMWMNFLGVAYNVDANKRFKRLPLHKTDYQLEQYRLRQLTSFRRIFDLIYSEQEPQWNTGICSNVYRRNCQYKAAHSQNSEDNIFKILSLTHARGAIWNPDLSHEKERKNASESNTMRSSEI
jgi:hypothetical protein